MNLLHTVTLYSKTHPSYISFTKIRLICTLIVKNFFYYYESAEGHSAPRKLIHASVIDARKCAMLQER
jgi:hypothetical protein